MSIQSISTAAKIISEYLKSKINLKRKLFKNEALLVEKAFYQKLNFSCYINNWGNWFIFSLKIIETSTISFKAAYCKHQKNIQRIYIAVIFFELRRLFVKSWKILWQFHLFSMAGKDLKQFIENPESTFALPDLSLQADEKFR